MSRVHVGALLLATLSACTDTSDDVDSDDASLLPIAAHDPSTVGPWPVGVQTIVLPDFAGYTGVEVEVWYPAAAAGTPGTYDFLGGNFPANATRNATPAEDAHQLLVAFSHGLGGVRQQNFSMAERLASHGFVVVAPDHPGTTTLDYLAGFDDLGADLVRRPFTIITAVDAVLDGVVPGVRPPADGYAMTGHSLGGWTTMGVAGAELSNDAYESTCGVDPHPSACDLLGDVTYSLDDLAAYGGPDPRVVTSVLQSPAGYYAYAPDTLAGVADPLVLGGPKDTIVSYEEEIVATYARVGTQATLATFDDVGHYGFTDMCVLSIATLFAPDCEGAAGGFADPDATRDRSITLTLAWIGSRLGQQPAYADALVGGDGVTLTSR